MRLGEYVALAAAILAGSGLAAAAGVALARLVAEVL